MFLLYISLSIYISIFPICFPVLDVVFVVPRRSPGHGGLRGDGGDPAGVDRGRRDTAHQIHHATVSKP